MIKKILFFARLVKRFGIINAIRLFNSDSKKTGTLDISFNAVKYPISLRYNTSDINVFYQVFYHIYYSFNYDTYLPKVRTIIDGGANIGLTSVYFKNLFPDASIIAIEPETSNYEALRKNTEKYNNINCIKAGVWNKSVPLKVTDKYEYGNWGFVVEEVANEEESNVKGISIPDILEMYNLDEIDILKLDIEGSELEVFQENYDWLDKVNILIVEPHDFMRSGTSKSLFKAIINYDFIVNTCRENLVFIKDKSKK
jgi:FkbM family methyltransferase